jgi:hypothetical protein
VIKIVLIYAALMWARAAFPQGTILFINRGGVRTTSPPGQVQAPIYREDPSDPTHRISGNTPTDVPAGSASYNGAAFVAAGQGPTFTATLWGANSTAVIGNEAANNLALLANGTTTFRTVTSGTFAGIVNEPPDPARVPGTPFPSDRGTFQVRVWDTRNGAIATMGSTCSRREQRRPARVLGPLYSPVSAR